MTTYAIQLLMTSLIVLSIFFTRFFFRFISDAACAALWCNRLTLPYGSLMHEMNESNSRMKGDKHWSMFCVLMLLSLYEINCYYIFCYRLDKRQCLK